MKSVTAEEFRVVLRQYATGVTVITARDHDGKPVGMTVNSFASVSLEPPLVLWSVDKRALQFPVFANTDRYGVHILRNDQQPMANRFSEELDDLFTGVNFNPGQLDVPLLADTSVSLECAVVNRYHEGDHIILIGRVCSILSADMDPLLFFGGNYRRLER